MSWHRKARGVRLRSAVESCRIEALEERRLLATFIGGDVFEFFDPLDSATSPATRRIIRMVFNGNITAEVVGAVVSPANVITATHIPGNITSSTTPGRIGPVAGGLGGGAGYQLIGPTPINDPINGPGGTFTFVPQAAVNLNALASDQFGNTYAFHVVPVQIANPVPGQPPINHALIQLVQLDTSNGSGTVVASLERRLPTDVANDALILPIGDLIGTSTVTSILAADFGPDGLLYFVAVDNTPTVGFATPRLYTVDVNATNALGVRTFPVTQVPGTFQTVDAASFADVRSIAFDNSGQLVAYLVRGNAGQLATVNLANSDLLTAVVNVQVGTTALTTVTGIEIIPGDPTVYAVTQVTNQVGSLYAVDRFTGTAVVLGNVPDVLPQGQDWSLQGLTYNPQLVDPFTGQLGVLMATETVNDWLIYISRTPRLGHHIFSIDVVESDATAQIIVAPIDRETGNMVPFSSTANIGGDALQVTNTQGGPPIFVAAGADTGGVFLGQRTVDIAATTNVDESLVPFLTAPLNGPLGTVSPAGGVVQAGLFVRENLLGYVGQTRADSLIGDGFTLVRAMGISTDGLMAVVNSGSIPNRLGFIVPGDTSIVPGSSVPITLAATGTPLAGVQAVAWLGNVLYAVIPLPGGNTLGVLAPNGVFTPGPTLTTLPGGVNTMAFTADGRLLVVDNAGTLHEIDPNTGLELSLPIAITANGAPVNLSAIAFAPDGQMFALDATNGRLVDFDPTTGIAGFRTATPQGSVRATATTLAYDPISQRFLTIDSSLNSPALMFIQSTASTAIVAYANGTRTASLLGAGFTSVTAMAARGDGSITVVAVDPLLGAQMGTIGPNNSAVLPGSVAPIILAGTGVPVLNIEAVAWGTINGVPTLYAVATLLGVSTLGTLANNGVFTPIGALPSLLGVSGMAFAPDGQLWIVDTLGQLQEIDPATAQPPVPVPPATAPLPVTVRDALGTITVGGMAFDATGALVAWDTLNARLVTIDPGTGLATAMTANNMLPATIGDISFDPIRQRVVMVDNAAQAPALLVLVGTESTAPSFPQDLGKFLFDGIVTGLVNVSGSMDTFYAGWIVTGQTTGMASHSAPTVPRNFYVGGELRNLFSFDSFGTDDASELNQTSYTSGFDLYVGGRLGQVVTRDHFLGSVTVGNNGRSLPAGTFQVELETRGTNNAATISANFAAGLLQNERFNNDTFDNPQYLGVINSTLVGTNAIHVTGSLNTEAGDAQDFFGVALMAGQTVVVQLVNSPGLNVGVFDPDGRQVATDYSNMDASQFNGQRFQITTDRPGVWRFAVTVSSDPDFDGGEFTPEEQTGTYTLTVAGVGNVALGGLVAANNIYDGRSTGTAWHVQDGDLGAIVAGGEIASSTIATVLLEDQTPLRPEDALVGATIEVTNGDLRTLQGAAIGETRQLSVELDVFNGRVGLVGTTSSDLRLNSQMTAPPRVSSRDPQGVNPLVAIRGEYQLIDVAGDWVNSALLTNTRIGVIRIGGDLLGGLLLANADKTGRDGTIDLIDVAGNIGAGGGQGIPIITGPGGDVRYIVVGGTAFRDGYFGGGTGEETTYRPGETAVLRDDSGGLIKISPGTATATLTILTYPIRGSGGSVVVNVSSTGPVIVRNHARSPAGAAVEVGRINVGGNFVQMEGKVKVDVFEIVGGALDRVINNTGGEFVNLTATSVNRLVATNLGVAAHNTPAHVHGQVIRANNFPFSQQRTLIDVSGTINILQAKQAVGNVSAGTINQLIADSDRRRNPNVYEGIVGPIFVTGNLPVVDIGQGILPSGTGNMAHAGLFANGFIGIVSGNNADIRGDIVSNTRIDQIRLRNSGSIINADIMMVSELAMSREFVTGHSTPGDNDPVNNTIISEIGNIFIDGAPARRGQPPPMNGGILGTLIMAADVGLVRVRNGFGFINSSIRLPAGGTAEGLEISGYGIRDAWLPVGAVIKRLVATGAGGQLPTTNFSPQLRASETFEFDPFTGFPPNRLTDLHVYLGTTAATPLNPGVTEAGRVAGVTVLASRDATLIKAWQMGTSNQLGVPVTTDFNIANSIKTFQTLSDVNDIQITTGEMGSLLIGGNAIKLNMHYAGLFSKLQVTGNFDADSLIDGIGPDSEIITLFIGGDMAGTITALADIGRATVKGAFTGQILVNGVPITPQS